MSIENNGKNVLASVFSESMLHKVSLQFQTRGSGWFLSQNTTLLIWGQTCPQQTCCWCRSNLQWMLVSYPEVTFSTLLVVLLYFDWILPFFRFVQFSASRLAEKLSSIFSISMISSRKRTIWAVCTSSLKKRTMPSLTHVRYVWGNHCLDICTGLTSLQNIKRKFFHENVSKCMRKFLNFKNNSYSLLKFCKNIPKRDFLPLEKKIVPKTLKNFNLKIFHEWM